MLFFKKKFGNNFIEKLFWKHFIAHLEGDLKKIISHCYTLNLLPG